MGRCCGEAELGPTAWPRTLQPRPSVGPCPRCRAQPPPAARPPPAQCRAFIIFVFPSLVLLLYKNMSVCCIATYLAIKYCIYMHILPHIATTFSFHKINCASRIKKTWSKMALKGFKCILNTKLFSWGTGVPPIDCLGMLFWDTLMGVVLKSRFFVSAPKFSSTDSCSPFLLHSAILHSFSFEKEVVYQSQRCDM